MSAHPTMADTARYRYLAPRDMPGVEILSAENNDRLFKVFHTTYAMCTMLDIDGYTEWRYRGRSVVSAPRHVALMEPGETHENTRTVGRWPFDVLFVAPALMADVATAAGLRAEPRLRMPTSSIPRLVDAFATFHRRVKRGESLLSRQEGLLQALHELLAHATEVAPRRPARPPRRELRRIREYLVEHWNQDVDLEQLSRLAGLSRFHVVRSFRDEFGMPPHQFHLAVRIENCRDLLRAGVDVRDIDAGFADQSHFIREFRRRMLVTPREYQTMVRG